MPPPQDLRVVIPPQSSYYSGSERHETLQFRDSVPLQGNCIRPPVRSLCAGAPKKKRRKLPYEKLYISALPTSVQTSGPPPSEDRTLLWWRAFAKLRKEIPETRLGEEWVDAWEITPLSSGVSPHGDTTAHTAIQNLVTTLERTKADLLRGPAPPPMLVEIQRILDISKVMQSTIDLKSGGFIWTCLYSVIGVSYPPSIINNTVLI